MDPRPPGMLMAIELSYGSGRLVLDLPDSFSVDSYAPADTAEPWRFEQFESDLAKADAQSRLRHARPLVVVNDGYRNTPTEPILTWLDRIEPTLLDRAEFIIATGTHDAPTEKHYQKIFGSHLDRVRPRVAFHSATGAASMVAIGEDPGGGGEVRLNRAYFDHEAVIIIGSVEPHYFAGFTGGRKSLIPGLADLATTARNHNRAASLEARPLRLAGNPVSDNLDELMTLLDTGRCLSIQAVMDRTGKLAGVYCGGLKESFAAAVATARRIYARTAPAPYDIVIAEMRPPLDRNLYQAQKGVENTRDAVADGGALILVSACPEGIGSPHFYDLAANWDREANRPRTGPPTFGSHKLSRLIDLQKRIRVLVYSGVKDEDVRRVFYEPLDKVAEFLYSRQNACEKCNVAVVYDAGQTVLTV